MTYDAIYVYKTIFYYTSLVKIHYIICHFNSAIKCTLCHLSCHSTPRLVPVFMSIHQFQIISKREDTKGVIRICKWKKNRQHNGQKKKDKQRSEKNMHKTNDLYCNNLGPTLYFFFLNLFLTP
jgi:hypothetical protein